MLFEPVVNQVATQVDFLGLVVEGNRRHTQYVGPAKIEQGAILLEVSKQFFAAMANGKRLLTAITSVFIWCYEFDGMATPSLLNVVESVTEVCTEVCSTLLQVLHASPIEYFQRSAVGGHAQNRGVAELPSCGPMHGFEARLHFKTRRFIMSPPAGKTGKIGVLRMSLVHKQSARAARSTVEVFVGAPNGKVGAPFVQF